MIIKNPYGFYAKYHKIIHLLLLIPTIYLLFCLNDISNFFKSFVRAGYSTPESNITDTYINGYLFLLSFIMAIANGIIFIILSSKKKKAPTNAISALYYIVVLFFLLLFGSSMSAIEKNELTSTFANLVRDCANLVPWPLYIDIAINIAKGVGFSIRTLRFDAGSDLKISEEDEEDIELNFGSEQGSIKRNIVHIIHELKYYILENLFVMKCIGFVVIIAIGYNLYSYFQVYNKTYAVNQAFQLSNFTLALKDSYITNVDYRGNIIDSEKYYLVIKVGIENNGPHVAIEKSNFRIVVDKEILYPSYDKGSRFRDIGATYQGDIIYSSNPKYYKQGQEIPEGKDYVFVYEITKKQIKSSYQMRILSSLTQTYEGLEKKYKKITIKPQNIVKTQNIGKAKTGQEIRFKDTTLGKTTYKINSYKIDTYYQYSYEQCNGNTTSCVTINDTIASKNGKMLLIIDDELKWDETTQYYKNDPNHDFYADFVTLNYSFTNFNLGSDAKEEIENSITLENIAPKTLRSQNINVYEVPSTMRTVTKMSLTIKVRNKYLTVVIQK